MGTFSHHLAACLLHTPIQAGLHGQESCLRWQEVLIQGLTQHLTREPFFPPCSISGSSDLWRDGHSNSRHQETRTFQRTMETLWPLIMEEGSQASQSGAVRTDAGRRSRGRGEAGLPGPWRASIDQVRSPTTLPWPVLPSG